MLELHEKGLKHSRQLCCSIISHQCPCARAAIIVCQTTVTETAARDRRQYNSLSIGQQNAKTTTGIHYPTNIIRYIHILIQHVSPVRACTSLHNSHYRPMNARKCRLLSVLHTTPPADPIGTPTAAAPQNKQKLVHCISREQPCRHPGTVTAR